MSLINEALKKAQERQNSTRPQGMSSLNDTPPAAPTSQQKRTQFLLVGIFVLMALMIVSGATGLIVYGLANKDTPSPVSSSNTTASSASEVDALAAANLPESQLERIAFSAPETIPPTEPSSTPPQSTAPQAPESSAPVANNPTPEITPSPTPALATPSTTEVTQIPQQPSPLPEPISPPKPTANPEIESFLSSLQIRGIMSGGSKVLIFDPSVGSSTAYEKDSALISNLNITITTIEPRHIEFKDNAGYTYIKRF